MSLIGDNLIVLTFCAEYVEQEACANVHVVWGGDPEIKWSIGSLNGAWEEVSESHVDIKLAQGQIFTRKTRVVSKDGRGPDNLARNTRD